MTMTRTFIRDNDDQVAVEYNATGGSPAVTWGPPEYCDPGEPPEIEIESVTSLADGSDVTLSDAEVQRFATEAIESWEGDDGPDPDDLRDQRIDDRLTGGDHG